MADCEKIHEMDPFKYKLKTLKIKKIEKICLKPKPVSVPNKLHGSKGKNKMISYKILIVFHLCYQRTNLTHIINF